MNKIFLLFVLILLFAIFIPAETIKGILFIVAAFLLLASVNWRKVVNYFNNW